VGWREAGHPSGDLEGGGLGRRAGDCAGAIAGASSFLDAIPPTQSTKH
jgi:hypothetical protein